MGLQISFEKMKVMRTYVDDDDGSDCVQLDGRTVEGVEHFIILVDA